MSALHALSWLLETRNSKKKTGVGNETALEKITTRRKYRRDEEPLGDSLSANFEWVR